jgi:hypothetical protein
MRSHGHEIVGKKRVPGGLFTIGAIWSGEPMAQPAPKQVRLRQQDRIGFPPGAMDAVKQQPSLVVSTKE